MHRYFIFTLFTFMIFSGSISLVSQEYFVDYNSKCADIYTDITDLKLNSARQKIKAYQINDSFNLAYIHLENYIDFFELFISENKSRFNILEKNKDIRISQIKTQLDDSDPFKKFVLAEINLQWALTRAKFDQLFKAGREVYAAYSLLESNQDQFPEFIHNKKSLSIIHTLIETIRIPGFIKKLLGMEGSIHLGIEEIQDVLQFAKAESYFFENEAEAIYTYILFYQANQKKSAFEFIKQSNLNHRKSLLANFLKVKIAQRSGNNDIALRWLSERPIQKVYAEFHYMEFLEGLSKLRKLDSGCIVHFEKYVSRFDGLHYIKEAYQKLAWAHLIFYNDENQYFRYMKMVRNFGKDQLDGDKQALSESKAGKVPNAILLKARILYDGGYYNQALLLLSQNGSDLLKNDFDALEYYYRMGRISQALNDYKKAISYYNYLTENRKFQSSYFVCNASLQSGLIYEEKKEWKMAEKYFKQCLGLSPDTYKLSIHQKAKTGLQRLKK